MNEHEKTDTGKDNNLFDWLISHGISKFLVEKIRAIWRGTIDFGRKIILLGETIVVELVKFAPKHPYMTIGALTGFCAAVLLNQIPVVGWLIGPAVSCLTTIVGAYLGHLADKPDGNIISFFYVILDVVYRIFKEVSNPEKNEEANNCVFAESTG